MLDNATLNHVSAKKCWIDGYSLAVTWMKATPGPGNAREIEEGPGITEIALHPWHARHGDQPGDIETEPISARLAKDERARRHHDSLYVFVAERTPIGSKKGDFSSFPVRDP
jgi:hypothetical protein